MEDPGAPKPAAAAPRPAAAASKLERLAGRRDAPDEITALVRSDEYLEYREITDMREPYRVPPEYLIGAKKYVGPDVADTPLIVFINAKSGGHVGPQLTTVLFRCLGQAQVFDLSESRPGPVLRTIWDNLLEKEGKGDVLAGHIRRNLRILTAGGDGTVTWVLKTIQDLGLDPAPAVAVMPLGTGNDLALSFGWGNQFLPDWIRAPRLYRTLKRYADAEVRLLDSWRVDFSAPAPGMFADTPHSLTVPDAGANGSGGGGDLARTATGSFWNYFSVGLDAEAAYGFHSLRESKPWAASTRVMNQAWYSYFSCTTGWFCGAAPLTSKLKLRVKDGASGEWRNVGVPRSIRAVVLLNLQSYGGGRDIWGLSEGGAATKSSKGFASPIFDDGIIEVVGFRSGWHTAVVMGQVSSKIHGTRLAQGSEVEMELAAAGRVKGEAGVTYMQLDGEPWRQELPAAAGAEPLRLRVSHGGRSRMLFNVADTQGKGQVKKLAKRGARHTAAPEGGGGGGLAAAPAAAAPLASAEAPAGFESL